MINNEIKAKNKGEKEMTGQEKKSNAAAYARVATKEQATNGSGFDELNIQLLSATESNASGATRNFQRGFLALMAQYNNDLRAERVVLGMKRAFKSGRWLWGAPFGYINDKTTHNIVPDETKSEIVKRIFKNVANGYSYEDLYWELSMLEVEMKPKTLLKILTNPIYCGYLYKPEWFDKKIKGTFKPLVSTKVFNTVQEVIKTNSWQR